MMAVGEVKNNKRSAEEEPEAPPTKRGPLNFSITSFQKKLKKQECIAALKEFVYLCQRAKGQDDPATQFLRGGGQISDILMVLDQGQKEGLDKASAVFSAIHVLLLRVMTEVPEERETAKEMCHHLLNTHLDIIHNMLGPNKPAYMKKIVLKLLTAMVTFSATFARDILSYVSLTLETVDAIVVLSKPNDPQSVRICFIQFLMAFLVEGNISVICLLLEKRLILTSIISQLEYDPSNLVIFVLTTLRTKVVEVKEISKTMKMHTFNTRVLSQLLGLYNWKGPGFLYFREKKTSEVSNNTADDKKAVAEAVHALLLTLCTSYNYGVVFRDPTWGFIDSKNGLITSVVKELKQPWENQFLGDLAAKIVQIVPTSAQILYDKVANVLQPRASSSWIKAVTFVTQIFTSINLRGLASVEPHVALSSSKVLAAPMKIVRIVAVHGLVNKGLVVCQKIVEFLKALLGLTEVCLGILTGHEAVAFQNHVMSVVPNVTVLQQAWDKIAENNTAEKGVLTPNQTQLLLDLLDIMFMYQKHFPQLMDSGETLGDLIVKLASFLSLRNELDDRMIALHLKIMQFLLLFDTSVLVPEKNEYHAAIGTLLYASGRNDALSMEAQNTLGTLLLKYRVLEPEGADALGELGLWLQCVQTVSPTQRPVVLSFLQNIFVTVSKQSISYIERSLSTQEIMLSDANSGKIKNLAAVNQADQLFQELLEMVDVEKSDSQEIKKKMRENEDKGNINFSDHVNAVELSLVLLCALDVVESKETLDAAIVKYLSHVFVHLLHFQSDPVPFITIVRRCSTIPSKVLNYLESWNTDQPIVLTKPFGSCAPETSLSRMLLEQTEMIPELEDCSDPRAILLLERLVIFYIAQMAERYQLTENVISASLETFMALLKALQENISHNLSSFSDKYFVKFFSIILKHPILLSYFSPLHKKKQFIETQITDFLLDFLERAAESTQSAISKDASVLLKDKFLRNISHYINRIHVPTNTQTLLKAAKLLALTQSEMCKLISKLCEKIAIQPWTDLVSYLLCKVNCLPSELVSSLITSLAKHLKENETKTAWNVVKPFHQYLQRFPYFVHLVTSDLFEPLVCKQSLDLACFILHHHQSYVPILITLVKQNNSICADPEVLFPLLSSASHHGHLPSSFLQIVYKKYKQEIIEAMQPPLSSATYFENYAEVIQQIVVKCTDPDECHSICLSLVQNWKNPGLCKPYHLSVIKGLKLRGSWNKLGSAVVQLLLHQLKLMLQMNTPPTHTHQLCSLLRDVLDDTQLWQEHNLESCETWLPQLILQNGLRGTDHKLTHSLFSTLACLLSRTKDVQMASQVFEMITSHSRFLDIVLAKENEEFKLPVLQLVLTCYRLSPLVMKASQVPVWLGAYGASLSHCDQVILKILHCLNSSGKVDLNVYRPFLWGDAAINHYSVRSRAGMSLWRVPQATAVINLLQSETIKNTIAKFPLHRKLLLKGQENVVGINTFVEDLEPCQPDIYDPAFMMPLLSHITAPESVILERKFMRAGGLALALIPLGSECEYMRSAAASTLARIYNRLNPKKPSEQLAGQFLESVRAGIGNLISSKDHATSNSAVQEENNSSTSYISADVDKETVKNDNIVSEQSQTSLVPKVPNLSAAFIAQMSLIVTDPSHTLYKPLTRFLLAKPAVNLKTVPEFLGLVRPGAVDYSIYQKWLMETLSYGIRTDDDLDIARNVHLFKILCALFSSSLSTPRVRTQILIILETTLRIPTGSTILIKGGILPWLYSTFNHLQKEKNGHLIIAFIRVIIALKKQAPSLVNMVIPFLLKLPPVIETSDLHSILQVALDYVESISQDHLVVLLRVCQRVLDHKIVQEYSLILGITAKIVESELPVEPNKTVTQDNTEASLSDLLKCIVDKWLILNSIPYET